MTSFPLAPAPHGEHILHDRPIPNRILELYPAVEIFEKTTSQDFWNEIKASRQNRRHTRHPAPHPEQKNEKVRGTLSSPHDQSYNHSAITICPILVSSPQNQADPHDLSRYHALAGELSDDLER